MSDQNENQTENTQAEVSPADYNDREAGNTPEQTQPGSPEGDTNPESGNPEQQAEVSNEAAGEAEGENPVESTGENPEVPVEGAPEEGAASEDAALPGEDGVEETQPTGEDEVEGTETVSQDGRPKASDEEKAEYTSLQHKRTQTNLTPEDQERMDYLEGLNHD